MHELSIVIELYRVCREEIESRGGDVLHEVVVAVGELSAVEPDLLQFAWEATVVGSRDEEAVLLVEWRPAIQTCPSCGPVAERQPGSWLRLCPACDEALLIEGGRELDVIRLVFDQSSTVPSALSTAPVSAQEGATS